MARPASSKSVQGDGYRSNAAKANSFSASSSRSSASRDAQSEHPVEVIGRIRDYPNAEPNRTASLEIKPDIQSVRVRADYGYREFVLDGVSLSEEEDVGTFYENFVKSRIDGVKFGNKCTVLMYGPTGTGKSYTMFGSSKQPGIVYRSLRDILGEQYQKSDPTSERLVRVTVLEIYNEEVYDLLSENDAGGLVRGWPNSRTPKVRLEVMGKKAKNASYITGNEAERISEEIQKVEKRRIIKSTLRNDASSRSHCMIILDVPAVGGRLILVDMAGSENIEQAGQVGLEAKLQTAKINQGNIALKRVVESIANGDSHVPFRDSKLTMILQDSFEDDRSKILMILCASTDHREIHKTVSTLEYGAKAKCIVRDTRVPMKDKSGAEDRIRAMAECICKLEQGKKLKEKEKIEERQVLERELAPLRARLELLEGSGSGASKSEIRLMVEEMIRFQRFELEEKLEDYKRTANELVELEWRRMEDRISQQQGELEMLKRLSDEIFSFLCDSKSANCSGQSDTEYSRLARRLLGIYESDASRMMKSLNLGSDRREPSIREVKCVVDDAYEPSSHDMRGFLDKPGEEVEHNVFQPNSGDGIGLSLAFEKEEAEEESGKEIMKEKMVSSADLSSLMTTRSPGTYWNREDIFNERAAVGLSLLSEPKTSKDAKISKNQNTVMLHRNCRKLSQNMRAPIPSRSTSRNGDHLLSRVKTIGEVEKTELLIERCNQILSNNATESEITETAGPLRREVSASEENGTVAQAERNKDRASERQTTASKNRGHAIESCDARSDVHLTWKFSFKVKAWKVKFSTEVSRSPKI